MRSPAILRFILAALLLAAVASAQRRGVTPEDYFAFETVSDPHLSPDGMLVAYVVNTVDQKANRRHSSIWMAAADGCSIRSRAGAEAARG